MRSMNEEGRSFVFIRGLALRVLFHFQSLACLQTLEQRNNFISCGKHQKWDRKPTFSVIDKLISVSYNEKKSENLVRN